MKFVRFEAKEDVLHLVPAHIVYLRESGERTVIGLSTGRSVKVEGDVASVLARLEA